VVVIVAAAVVGNTVVSTLTHLHLLVVSILIHTDPSVNTLTLMDLGDMDLVVVVAIMEPLVASTLILMVLGVVALGVVSTLTPSLAMRP